jgi:diadenylate cyclase
LIFFIVIFQGEIRQILEQLDPRLPVTTFLHWGNQVGLPDESLSPIADTLFTLASKRCGALVVLEQHDPLDPLLRSPGEVIDARISPRLLETLFTPPTPLHDGALYIRKDRIYRAGCVLPLSENRLLAPFYGTRHRAALGIAEQSDALVVVVSEERGTVSVVENSTLTAVSTPTELLAWLKNRRGAREEPSQRLWPLTTLVTDNWRLKLAALAAVSLLWFVLVERQDTEVGFSVPLVYRNVPPELMIEDKDVQEVYVSVRGSPEILNFLDTKRLRVTLNLRGAKEGWQRYTISADDINLPLGLQLAQMSPSELKLRLSRKPSAAKSG